MKMSDQIQSFDHPEFDDLLNKRFQRIKHENIKDVCETFILNFLIKNENVLDSK